MVYYLFFWMKRYTNLSGKIGYRRLIETEEWLEKHGMIIKRKMVK